MQKIKCLIVDDSVIYRSQVRSALEKIDSVEILGSVSNGVYCLKRLESKKVDLVILDLEMPEMDGIETLKQIVQRNIKVDVIMFASQTFRSAEITLEALSLGAKDFVAKPGPDDSESKIQHGPAERILRVLEPKIRGLFPGHFENQEIKTPVEVNQDKKWQSVMWDLYRPDILVIGSSTGGPTALEKIFAKVKSPLGCPVVITQHMPPVFTRSFAERLGKVARMPSFEATAGLTLQPNHIYVAPGDFHLTLVKENGEVKTFLDQRDLGTTLRPAVDPLFESAANIYGQKCLGIILTGMGSDGCIGSQAIKEKGGAIVIQNKETCAVWGMPAMVHKAGHYDRIEDLESIAQTISEKLALRPGQNPGRKIA